MLPARMLQVLIPVQFWSGEVRDWRRGQSYQTPAGMAGGGEGTGGIISLIKVIMRYPQLCLLLGHTSYLLFLATARVGWHPVLEGLTAQ